MDDLIALQELLSQVRAGEVRAAAELVRRYETVIRAAVRIRLTDPALRRQFDSQDVCQSVLCSFFVRAAAGMYDFDRPDQLVALLVRMADYKFRNRARNARRRRRDVQRVDQFADLELVATTEPGPEHQAIQRDLMSAIHGRLNDEERLLVDRRTEGCTWPEIASELGGTAQARRRQLDRALGRAAEALGLDDCGEFDE